MLGLNQLKWKVNDKYKNHNQKEVYKAMHPKVMGN